MDTKTFTIGVLSVIAAVLFAAQFLPSQPAVAATSIKDRDYQMATARATQGGENLYVIDNGTGMLAVFTWDPNTRTLKPSDVQAMTGMDEAK